jgi:predicted metal-dependent phosphoesterase TrpH
MKGVLPAMAIDLHLHSSASDGGFTPRVVVEHAHELGLRCIALTDHDTVEGIDEASARAEELNIPFIRGIELTAQDGKQEVHILGYFIDHHNERLLQHLHGTLERIVGRVEKIVAKLNHIGYPVTMEEVKEIAGKGTMGRPHIARAMQRRGYIRTHQEAFNRFLGENCPAFVEVNDAIPPPEAYELILEAGGIPSIAHPGFLGRADMMGEIEVCNHIEWGAMAIEIYHPRHDNYMVDYYKRLARKYSLAVTGGSDCHGNFYQYILMDRKFVPDWVAEKFLAFHEKLSSKRKQSS